MVYIGNIFKAYENLEDKQAICLIDKSRQRYFITKGDGVEKINGDLKISKRTCYCIIDCNEIVNMIVANEKVLRGE